MFIKEYFSIKQAKGEIYLKFKNLTPVNGFDSENLNNARQNNYAWSMGELGNFIYVGTGRNILLNIIKAIEPQTEIPDLIKPDPVDNLPEIWRYQKYGRLPWERVYKADPSLGITGLRFMVNHIPFGGSPCLYTASFGGQVKILKTTNGVNWFVMPGQLQGSSSRAMISHKGKLYVATVDEANQNAVPLLYSSQDPEFYPWEFLTDSSKPGFDPERNPQGGISNMAVFNSKIYVATSGPKGAQVWRTNEEEPHMNDWTLIASNGFGDPLNQYTLSIGTFGDFLYVGATKPLPLAWFIPLGCDVIRIDKYDNWEVVVGGNPFLTDDGNQSIHRPTWNGPGFSNPFNVYAWQIQEYEGQLLISTFDDSSNMEVILTTLLANEEALYNLIGYEVTKILIDIYKAVVKLLRAVHYPIGFDLYISSDGKHFRPVFLNGINNPNNYGGRILFVDKQNTLFLGTANPFQGCEVYKVKDLDYNECSYHEEHYRNLWKARDILHQNYSLIEQHVPAIMQLMSKNKYKMFINVI